MREHFIVKLIFPNGNIGYCVDTAYDSYHTIPRNAEMFDTKEDAINRAVGHINHFKNARGSYFQIESIYY